MQIKWEKQIEFTFAFDNYVPKHALHPPSRIRARTRRRTKTRVTPHKKCQVFIDGNATKERHDDDGDGDANNARQRG